MKRVLFSALIGTFVACAASAQPITCPPLPSTSDVKRSFAVGTEVSLLSRFLNSFGLNYKKQTAIKQNLSQLPNADELYTTLYFMSIKCQSIMAQRVPEEEKLRQWNDYIDQMNDHLSKSTPPIPLSGQERRDNILPPDPDGRPLPPKPEPWVAPLIGSWESKLLLSNNIPYILVYTFYPDGSFLSSSATGDNKSRGRFQYERGHVLIKLDDGTSEYAELHMMENQFRYRIVDHANQAAIGHEVIFRRLHR